MATAARQGKVVPARRTAKEHALRVEDLLAQLWDIGGTDLLLTAGTHPLVRVDGRLVPLTEFSQLTPELTQALTLALLTDDMAEQLRVSKEVDFSFMWRGVARFRGNAFRQRGSIGLALRLIPYHIPTFEELSIPPVLDGFLDQPQGLILVTGPTGAGKSTTLASMIDRINERRQCHILTIEDPIEYLHQHKQAAVNQREIGTDADSFDRALRAALREDPDVLLVGEMRDLETISTALTIAETGHLVFATLHTNDTGQAVDRIVDVFPAERQTQIRVQLAHCLTAVVFQRLVPRIGGGRIAAFEVLVATQAIRNLIREGKTRQLRNIVATSQKDGMQTLEMSLSALVNDGVVTREDALACSMHPAELRSR